MTASASTGLDLAWPADPRTRSLAKDLYASVAGSPLVSIHNGLPARYLAEDLPITDPVNLLISHDQGIQALLRGSGIRTEFTMTDGWRTEHASRQAFVLLWNHLVGVWAQPWMQTDRDETAALAGLPAFRSDQAPESVYDAVASRLAAEPMYPRRVIAAADLARFATSDDPADDLRAHEVLAGDSTLSGRVVPTFSPDRYLDPALRRWRTDADLLAEVTGIGTDDLDGFLAALRERRGYFLDRGATASEHHSTDVAVMRLSPSEATALYRLARSAELLPEEALALQGHLLWETGRMAADDGLVMGFYPPAGFLSPSTTGALGDAGVADRVRPLLADFGSHPRFRLQLFTIDTSAYRTEILPLAATHPGLAAVPPTRFADDPAELRAARVAAIGAEGVTRCLGVVDDMSGPFAMPARHRLGRRLDAGALAELVVAGRLTLEAAQTELSAAVDRTR
ncbi:MAG TPA: glucuronate isomerase [Microlunatus sp.]